MPAAAADQSISSVSVDIPDVASKAPIRNRAGKKVSQPTQRKENKCLTSVIAALREDSNFLEQNINQVSVMPSTMNSNIRSRNNRKEANQIDTVTAVVETLQHPDTSLGTTNPKRRVFPSLTVSIPQNDACPKAKILIGVRPAKRVSKSKGHGRRISTVPSENLRKLSRNLRSFSKEIQDN